MTSTMPWADHGSTGGYDGPTLRAIRESMGVPLRRIARQASMSHGHLSKVERGEYGRPITPAILAAYERVTGVSLAEAARALVEQRQGVTGSRGRTWVPGQLSDMRRLGFNAAIGAVAIGGQLGEPYSRLLDSTGRPTIAIPPRCRDAEQLQQMAAFVTSLDLRYGGGFTSQLSKAVLRWAVPMLDVVSLSTATGQRMYAAVAALAARAAWAAFDTGAHEAARSLYRLALYTAVRSSDANLRAHLLADAAAQHNHLGYHHDALDITRLVAGDERVSHAVRMVLHGVQARAYAAAGQADLCRRNITQAEQAHAEAADTQPDGWQASLCHPTHLAATTGHALAVLHQHTGEPADLHQAQTRLQAAAAGFDPTTHPRATALCMARLALLNLHTGDLAAGHRWATQALAIHSEVDSARLRRALTEVRKAAEDHRDEATMSELAAAIATATTATEPTPPGDQPQQRPGADS